MGRELINRITIKKDGRVVISTKSSNDTSPYSATEIESLTKISREKGMAELDKEIIRMCFSYCELRGTHPSVLKYVDFLRSAKVLAIRRTKEEKLAEVWNSLSDEDRESRWSREKTDAMRDYLEFASDYKELSFRQIAELLDPEYHFPKTIYHYDENGDEYWYDENGKKKFTKMEG